LGAVWTDLHSSPLCETLASAPCLTA
jgi:hypothetical protein